MLELFDESLYELDEFVDEDVILSLLYELFVVLPPEQAVSMIALNVTATIVPKIFFRGNCQM